MHRHNSAIAWSEGLYACMIPSLCRLPCIYWGRPFTTVDDHNHPVDICIITVLFPLQITSLVSLSDSEFTAINKSHVLRLHFTFPFLSAKGKHTSFFPHFSHLSFRDPNLRMNLTATTGLKTTSSITQHARLRSGYSILRAPSRLEYNVPRIYISRRFLVTGGRFSAAATARNNSFISSRNPSTTKSLQTRLPYQLQH